MLKINNMENEFSIIRTIPWPILLDSAIYAYELSIEVYEHNIRLYIFR